MMCSECLIPLDDDNYIIQDGEHLCRSCADVVVNPEAVTSEIKQRLQSKWEEAKRKRGDGDATTHPVLSERMHGLSLAIKIVNDVQGEVS